MSDEIQDAALGLVLEAIVDVASTKSPEAAPPQPATTSKQKQKQTSQSIPGSVFGGSQESVFKTSVPPIILYKLHLYRPDGSIRTEISKALFTEIAKKYGDLVKCIPSNRWSTMDELCEFVWAFEKRSYLKDFTRTRKQIEDGVGLCVEIGAVLKK